MLPGERAPNRNARTDRGRARTRAASLLPRGTRRRELRVVTDDREGDGRRLRRARAAVLEKDDHRDLRRLRRREGGEPGVIAIAEGRSLPFRAKTVLRG